MSRRLATPLHGDSGKSAAAVQLEDLAGGVGKLVVQKPDETRGFKAGVEASQRMSCEDFRAAALGDGLRSCGFPEIREGRR